MHSTWHTLDASEVIEKLGTSEHGLSKDEAARLLKERGPNKLPEAKADSLALIFLRQFRSPLIYILMAAALAVFLMGDAVDGAIIGFVLVFNAVVGTMQEGRAQNTLLALRRFVETKAVVLRGGEELIVPDSDVVAGDVLVLQEGEKIPADARLISATNLKADEAALTGESEAVHKITDTLPNADAPVLEQKNMVFKGTHVVAGSGLAVVVAVGLDTFIGRIAREIAKIDTEIPLKTNIRNLSRLIIMVTGIFSVVLFFVGLSTGKSAVDMFSTVVSVAVSVIPEGLPVAVTLILATGVWRMSKRNALVKRLQAVEALGQAQVIAVDKTGTITKNEMVIQAVYIDGKTYSVGGIGYEPKGEISLDDHTVNAPDHPSLIFAGRVATFCANARTMYSEDTKTWSVAGDPTEAAMYVLGQKLGFKKDDLERESPLIREVPFDYKQKYHLTVHKHEGKEIMTVVGAPEAILALSTKVWREDGVVDLSEEEKQRLEEEFINISSKGLRVLAFSTSERVPENLDPQNVHSLTFGGFFGMKDALRPEVKSAVESALGAGIRVVMITGDHKATAEALAKEAGIWKHGDRVLSGREIDDMSDNTLKETLEKTSVFARVTPEHKLRIVKAYKALGKVIAMTGDGVNDAPSLVAADLGVGMGKIGTEVAKEASDIVLLDDDFGSIVAAIEEGRSIYKTIKKVVLYLLSTSLGELLVISSAIFLALPLPLLPAQIIWLNFVTDGFFTVALAVEPKEEGLLRGHFKKPSKYLIDWPMARRMLLMALAMAVGTLMLFGDNHAVDLEKAWTVSLTLLAVYQWFNAWNCRSSERSVFGMNPFSNRLLVGATVAAVTFQLLAVYHPFFQSFLHTVPLDLSEWAVILAFGTSILLVEEVRKFFARRISREEKVSLAPALETA